MQMTKSNTETIMKEATISPLFADQITGFLYKEKVFIEMDYINNRPTNIFVQDDSAKEEVAKVLYLVESVIDSLGINLKEDTLFTQEAIEEKMMETFEKLTVSVCEFMVIDEGEEVDVFAPTDSTEKSVVDEVEEIVEEEKPATPTSLTGFSEIVKKSQEAEEVTAEHPTNEEAPQVEPSRQEKAIICKENLMGLITEPGVAYSAKELFPKLRDLVDFKVTSNETRNYLIDLTNDSKLEIASRNNCYQLPSFEQISLFEESTAVKEKTVPATKEKTVKQPVSKETNTVQPVPQPMNIVTVEEEFKTAENFSTLFLDDAEVSEYLNLIGVPKVLSDWAIEFRAHNRDRLKSAPQAIVDVIPNELSYLGNKETLMKSLAAMKSDTPLSLKGPAGTGKTTLVDTIGGVLNLPVFSINGSLESNKATLVGEPTIKQQGVISIKDGQMQKAAVYGGILYIDEINMMRPDILSIANSLLDHRKAFYNDVRSEMTFAVKETRFISAMNEGYAGTKQMNKATGDRKLAIRLDYMSKRELKDVLAKIVENTDDSSSMSMAERDMLIEKVAKFYSVLSQKAKMNLVPELAASTRSIIQLVKNVPILGFQMSLEMVFDKFTLEEVAQIKGALVGTGLEEELGVKFV